MKGVWNTYERMYASCTTINLFCYTFTYLVAVQINEHPLTNQFTDKVLSVVGR